MGDILPAPLLLPTSSTPRGTPRDGRTATTVSKRTRANSCLQFWFPGVEHGETPVPVYSPEGSSSQARSVSGWSLMTIRRQNPAAKEPQLTQKLFNLPVPSFLPKHIPKKSPSTLSSLTLSPSYILPSFLPRPYLRRNIFPHYLSSNHPCPLYLPRSYLRTIFPYIYPPIPLPILLHLVPRFLTLRRCQACYH